MRLASANRQARPSRPPESPLPRRGAHSVRGLRYSFARSRVTIENRLFVADVPYMERKARIARIRSIYGTSAIIYVLLPDPRDVASPGEPESPRLSVATSTPPGDLNDSMVPFGHRDPVEITTREDPSAFARAGPGIRLRPYDGPDHPWWRGSRLNARRNIPGECRSIPLTPRAGSPTMESTERSDP